MNDYNIKNDFLKLEEDLLAKWNETMECDEKCDDLPSSYQNTTERINRYEKVSRRRRLSREIFKNCAVAASILIVTGALLKYTFHITSYDDVVDTVIYSPKTLSLYAPNGKTTSVTLKDSTTVILNSGSVLIYPENFGTSSRELHLVGEAYFSVAQDNDRPFVVHTPCMKVRALGTSFTVKAYQKDETESTTLISGSIQVTPNNSSIPSKILSPDEQLILSHDGESYAVFNVNSKHDASWIDGKMIFENALFEDVIDRLECQFGVVIYYDKALYAKQKVVAKFIHNESLTEILDVLQKVCYFEYNCNENRCLIYKSNTYNINK